MDTNEFFVEGRYFENALYAFTFAGIQADRMDRAVEVHLAAQINMPAVLNRNSLTWHATAHPSHYARRHLVKE